MSFLQNWLAVALQNLFIPFKSLKSTLQSAVLFCAVFLLLSCDDVTKTTQTEQSNANTLLVYGSYQHFVLQAEQATSSSQRQLLRDLFEGLVIYDAKGNVIPAAAEQWQTADNKVWLFQLNPHLRWSNGDPLTAHDFVRSWQQLAVAHHHLTDYLRFLNLAHAEAVIKGDLPVEQLGVQALDDQTLRIQLEKPTPYLPQMLAHISLLPRHFVDPKLSNGAYAIEHYADHRVKLVKNPYYWQTDSVNFSQVEFRQINANQKQGIDVIYQPDFSQEVQYLPQLCHYFYEFNFQHPQLSKSAVRKALISMSSPRDMVKNLLPNQPIHTGLLPQSMQIDTQSSWEPTLVEQLLEQNGMSEKSPLKLRLTYDNSPFHSSVAQTLIAQWSQSDLIKIEADPVDWKTLLEKRAKGDFQIIRSGWCADYNEPSAFLNVFHSHSPDNKFFYQNKQFDQHLEAVLGNITEFERLAEYAKAVEILQRDNVILPIFQYHSKAYFAPSLMGYDLSNPTEVIYSKDLQRK